jgi:excisionase family DNA binding protein
MSNQVMRIAPVRQLQPRLAMVPEFPKAYTPKTLAARWLCSERHIRNMIDRGELPAFRLGGKLLRIRREDVEAFEARRTEPKNG